MNRSWAIWGVAAVLIHAGVLFGFRLGHVAVPLPVSDTSVEVSLVAASAPPAPPESEPPVPAAPEPPPPLPEPERAPDPTPVPQQKPEVVPAVRRDDTPSPSPPRRANSVTAAARSPAAGPAIARNSAPATGARVRTNPKPVYPTEARRLRLQGRVILSVQVSADGHPTSILLSRSSGYPSLDAAALETVRRWTFIPAQAAGLAVASRVEVPVTFSLSQ
jgi:periplasmic protein TonB